MKLKALLLALFTAGFAVSIAVAASPATVDHGKPTLATATDGTTTSDSDKGEGHARKSKGHSLDHKKSHTENADSCRRARKIVVNGEFVAAGAGGFAMTVKGGNKHAKAWKGKQATVLVDDKTKFKGKKHLLADLAAGDRVNVQGYACKADVAAGTLLARRVTTKGPKGAKHEGASTTTTATTTAATTTAATTTAVTTTVGTTTGP